VAAVPDLTAIFCLADGYNKPRDIEDNQMKKQAIVAITIGFLPLVASCGSELVPTKLDSPQSITKSFTQWCEEKNNLPAESKLTVDLLLKEADTEDCKLANAKLRKLTQIDLYHNNITNLEPLASLSNLTSLDLIGNQISDLKPLAGLSNLTYLALSENKIIDVKPLAGLSNLTYLSLSQNQITDVKPLASLIKLTDLKLRDNQVVGKTICPVEAYICDS
jgi:internalin A